MALVQAVENGKITESTTETTTSAGNDLGYDEFLQLLCAEMQYQDPLEPTSNTEYVAQLATFSQMESMLNMQNSIESTKANTEYMEAVSLAEAFKASVAKLPDADKLTLAYQTDVENLATVYNGLTSYQQSYIDSDTLATFVKLDGTMKSLVFDNALSQIPSADELTLENKEAVEALRKNYDSLTTTEKTYISKDSYDQLTALEAKIAELEKKAE